ncbi:MAG: PAS domain-containing sensor histidine kinase, partial [Acidobacteriota bacterium]
GNYGIVVVLAVVNKAEDYSQEEARQLEAFAVGAQVILEQREIKRQLEESEKKYSALVENSLTGIFISSNGKILFVNRRFAEFYGFSVDELVGKRVDTFIHPEDLASFQEYERKAHHHESTSMSSSIRWIKKNGETAWTTVSNAHVSYQGNSAIVWNVNDITPIMDLEYALRESEQECRILSREILKAQENERKRVAREIHDSISQSLAALKFRLEDYSITAEQKTGEASKDLKFIIGMLQKTLKEVSRIMNDLRPAGLDELGILAAIADFCNDFQTTYPAIKISTKIGMHEQDVPEQIKAPAFRVLQEALYNAAKHSNADTVEVRFFQEGDFLTLQIKDNGVGFKELDRTTQRRHIKGLGLYSMQERANLSGGSLDIHSVPGTGTVVEAKWPIQSRCGDPVFPLCFDDGPRWF